MVYRQPFLVVPFKYMHSSVPPCAVNSTIVKQRVIVTATDRQRGKDLGEALVMPASQGMSHTAIGCRDSALETLTWPVCACLWLFNHDS